MKVSGNLSHMSGGHLHTLGLSTALSSRLHRALQWTETSCLFPFRLDFKGAGLKAALTQVSANHDKRGILMPIL